MSLSWSPWIVLNAEQIGDLAPTTTGVYEIKVHGGVLEYPSGKAAMIYYGLADTGDTLRAVLEREWIEAEGMLEAWAEYGELVWRFALHGTPGPEHERRLQQFVQRFGRAPWANT